MYLACIIGYLFFRNNAYKNAPIINDLELPSNIKERLILLAVLGSLLVLFTHYSLMAFSTHLINWKRASIIQSSFFVRIPLCFIYCCFCLYATKDKSHQYGRFILFIVIGFVTLVDMNREFLIAFGLICMVRHLIFMEATLFQRVFGDLL